jgi:hypothetical protein
MFPAALPSPNVVIPTQAAGKLECGKSGVSGEILLQQVVETREVKVPEAVASSDKVPVPAGLKCRWRPFGRSER